MTSGAGGSRLLRSWPAHAHGIAALAWTPGGELLASAGNDSLIHVWHAPTGELRATLEGHEGAVRCLDWSVDGSRLLSGADDGQVVAWDWSRAEVVYRHRDHHRWINAVAWSPVDSGYVSASGDGTLMVYDPLHRPVARLWSALGNFMSVAWSADGRRLATAARTNVVVVRETRSWTEICRFRAGMGTVWNVAWSPADRRLATAGQDGRIQFWDLDGSQPVQVIEAHTDTVARIAFSAAHFDVA